MDVMPLYGVKAFAGGNVGSSIVSLLPSKDRAAG
jgi:hypothetical protein